MATDHGSSITTPAYSFTGPWYTAPTGDLLLVTAGQGADRLTHVVQPDPHALGDTIAQQPAELGRVGVEQARAVVNGEQVEAETSIEVVTVTEDNVGDLRQ